MYKVVGHKTVVDENGNEISCEIREFTDMTEEQVEDMLQIMRVINDKGEEEYMDLRLL